MSSAKNARSRGFWELTSCFCVSFCHGQVCTGSSGISRCSVQYVQVVVWRVRLGGVRLDWFHHQLFPVSAHYFLQINRNCIFMTSPLSMPLISHSAIKEISLP